MEPTNEQLCALARGGDTDARNRLLENNFAFVQKKAFELIEHQKDCRLEADDLVQEGCFGLLEAIGRFDPERGTKFLTYAAYWIRKLMQEAVSITVANDEISLNELEEFSLSQVYRGLPEQIVLQAET